MVAKDGDMKISVILYASFALFNANGNNGCGLEKSIIVSL